MYFICYMLVDETKCEIEHSEERAIARAKAIMKEHDLDATEVYVFDADESPNLLEEAD